jgi:mannose-6-phosphate isomerase-like protein (cupin superfamily)
MRRVFFAVICVRALASCSSRQGSESSPPLAVSVTPAATSAASTPKPPATARGPVEPVDPPLTARFAELPVEIPEVLCHEVLVAVVAGEALVFGEKLVTGDVLVTFSPEKTRLEGKGTVVLVDAVEPQERCAVKARPATTRTVIRGQTAAPLVWANGSMQARLDVPGSVSPHVYLGRLEGTAPVAEHMHEGSWEILCAVDAAGTFTLGGVERRLGKREIVMVPAGTKHSWKPDAGSKLVGVQLYVPPGPEQRFKALAAAANSEPPPPTRLAPPPT